MLLVDRLLLNKEPLTSPVGDDVRRKRTERVSGRGLQTVLDSVIGTWSADYTGLGDRDVVSSRGRGDRDVVSSRVGPTRGSRRGIQTVLDSLIRTWYPVEDAGIRTWSAVEVVVMIWILLNRFLNFPLGAVQHRRMRSARLTVEASGPAV